MKTSSSTLMFLMPLFITLFFQVSDSKIVVVDGVEKWRNPSVQIGDTLIFKHKDDYNLYIFHNRGDFEGCNFTQAVLLTNPKSTSYMWHPSRPGFFYFSFNNGSLNACIGKLAIKVLSKSPGNVALSPGSPPQGVPTPVPGGIVSSTPAFFRPSFSPQASGPSTGPGATAPAALHPLLPDTGGGIPFINSNPAVPLPTGEADAASVRPMPTSGHGKQVVGFLRFQISLCYVVWLLLF